MSAKHSVRVNFLANVLGRGGLGLVHLLAIPVLLSVFSAEEYGMIGLYLSFFPAFLAVSTGLNAAFNRVTAQWQAGAFAAQDYHDLGLTLEMVCWSTGIVFFLLLITASGAVAENWLNATEISASSLRVVLILMFGSLCCQIPLSLYIAGLNGLQVQALSNGLQFSSFFVQAAGGLVIVLFFSRTLEAYFTWLLLVNIAAVLCARILYTFRAGPGRRRPRWVLLSRIAGMSGGSGGAVLLSICLMHADKIILSGLLDLEAFGVYSLAWLAASSLFLAATPFFAAVFPRMSELQARGEETTLAGLYHAATTYLSCLIFPPALILLLFPAAVLLAWTGQPDVAAAGGPLLALLAGGCLLKSLGLIPSAAQLAHGWTKPGLLLNTLAVAVYIPTVYLAATRFGAIGAAWAWAGLFALYYPVLLIVTHTWILRGELKRVVFHDLLPRLAAISGLLLILAMVGPAIASRAQALPWLALAGAAGFTAGLLTLASARRMLFARTPQHQEHP